MQIVYFNSANSAEIVQLRGVHTDYKCLHNNNSNRSSAWRDSLHPSIPLVSFLSPSLHPPKLRLRVASILQVDIQTKVRKIQEFTKIPGREKTDWGIETGS